MIKIEISKSTGEVIHTDEIGKKMKFKPKSISAKDIDAEIKAKKLKVK